MVAQKQPLQNYKRIVVNEIRFRSQNKLSIKHYNIIRWY